MLKMAGVRRVRTMAGCLVATMAALLAGCDGELPKKVTFPLPPELHDCQFFKLDNGVQSMTVARCPHSETTTEVPVGKTVQRSVVVDSPVPVSPATNMQPQASAPVVASAIVEQLPRPADELVDRNGNVYELVPRVSAPK